MSKKIVLATSNKGKVVEIKNMMEGYEVINYTDIIEPFHIEEDADTFKGNAIIKAKAVFEALNDNEAIVLSDDSGICVDVLDGAPGIYSARYAGAGANDKENLQKLVESIKAAGFEVSPAHYTAAIAIATKEGIFTVHGHMYGTAITAPRGDKGFGYDPMFIPEGFENTLGELDDEVKNKISHRGRALELAKMVIGTLS
ncbi:MAG TPA: RdgB/HAM1 family non-canonical purine NTP pyrophosphatase [Campylobacterales bacterium]|nr:RdgB/HAM1 family non-canonical purine NTP pyrophosphatase [Campylobacterales bacterium]